MSFSLDENTENLLFDYFSKNYPMVSDLSYKIEGDIFKLTSSTPFSEAKPTMDQYVYVESILNASFLYVVSNAGKCTSIFRFNK